VVVNDTQAHDRLAALEERLGRLEDQLAIERLINSWGPAVDVGNSRAARSLFTEDCILESDMSYLVGPGAIEEMVESEGQQALIRDGCAHIPASPLVTIDGDRATAVGYSRVYRHTPDGYEVWRVSANNWEFARTPDGWRMARRTAHVIDGTPGPKEMLNRVFDG
jgi:ketosteroid isomerase-like protein